MTEVECFDPLTNEWTLSKALPESRSIDPEMQKVADASDIFVLFFSADANFWAILGHFWAILAILGHFWANLGNFGSFLGYFG